MEPLWCHSYLMFDFLPLGKYHLCSREVAGKHRYKPLATFLPHFEGGIRSCNEQLLVIAFLHSVTIAYLHNEKIGIPQISLKSVYVCVFSQYKT